MKNNKKLVKVLVVILVVLIGILAFLFIKGDSGKEKAQGQAEEQQTEEQQTEEQGEDNSSDDTESAESAESTVEQQITEEEGYAIETKYGNLYYPKKWKDKLEVEIVEDEIYTVVFYGKVNGKDRQKLFEIVYNADALIMLGTIEVEGSNVYIGCNFTDIGYGEDWTDEDISTIYAMQEDVNYLWGMLEKEEGFTKEQ